MRWRFVEMDSGHHTRDPGEIIYTSGLCGCYAMVVSTESGETKEAILTHYQPRRIEENIYRIAELLEKHPEMRGAEKKKAVIFHSPYSNPLMVDVAEASIKKLFGRGTKVKRSFYDNRGSAPEVYKLAGDSYALMAENGEPELHHKVLYVIMRPPNKAVL